MAWCTLSLILVYQIPIIDSLKIPNNLSFPLQSKIFIRKIHKRNFVYIRSLSKYISKSEYYIKNKLVKLKKHLEKQKKVVSSQ